MTTVAELLRGAGLTPRSLAAWAGTDRSVMIAARLGSLGAPPPSPASAVLALFVAGVSVPRTLVAPALVASGLVVEDGAMVHALVTVLPIAGAFVVCDRADRAGDDVVGWPDDSSHHLASALPPGRRGTWLDLCCGSAYAPLLRPALASAIVGADLNPRATHFARLGVQLSGINHVEIRDGDLADAVTGQFDLVSCNAPIPAWDGEQGSMWRSGSADFITRVFEHAARVVASSGLVVVHAALDALRPIVADLPGERVVVAYTPADAARAFAVAWWRPAGEVRLVLARRELTLARPHLDHEDLGSAVAGTLSAL